MSASKPRKIRGDSTLGSLPPDRQEQIAAYAQTHTLDESVAWLKADGLQVSRTALSVWLSDFCLRRQFKMAEADTLTLIELLKRKRPEMPESEMQGYAAEFFQLQALKNNDSATFLAYATARHKAEMDKANVAIRRDQLSFNREKFQFDGAEAALKEVDFIRAVKADSKLSEAEKIDTVRLRLFGFLAGDSTTLPPSDPAPAPAT